MNLVSRFVRRALAAKRRAAPTLLGLLGLLAPTEVAWAQGVAPQGVQFSAPQLPPHAAMPAPLAPHVVAPAALVPYGNQRAISAAGSTPSGSHALPSVGQPAIPSLPQPLAPQPLASQQLAPQPLPVSPGGISFSRSAGAPAPGPWVPGPNASPIRPARWQDVAPESVPGASDSLGADTGASAAPNATNSTADPKSETQTLGEKPPEPTRTNDQFLRQQSILLQPGQYQFEVSLQYLTDETDFVLIRSQGGLVQIAEAQRRTRLLALPLEFRLGITDHLQAFINVPVGWSNNEIDFLGDAEFANVGGLGDISAGFTKLLIDGKKGHPDVLATFSFSAPTGQAQFASSLATPGSSLGQGFWTATGGMTFIHTYDPIIYFYGFGYQHRFDGSFDSELPDGDDVQVSPGGIAFGRCGIGFAVNPRVTLSGAFSASYIVESEVNGRRIGGSNREPMSVRLAATIVRDKKHKTSKRVETIEPFVNFGLTEGAIDSLFGVSLTH